MDRENAIKQIEKCISDTSCIGCPYEKSLVCRHYMLADALSMLKEQQQLIWELQDQVEYITDKQKEQKFFVDESGKITPLPVVVRCKDCKHYDKDMIYCNKFGIQNIDNDWFCADGEKSD